MLMKKIPISKPLLGEEEVRAVKDVLLSGNLIQGEKVSQFEGAFSTYIGAKHGIAVNSGTSALMVGLQALGIKGADEVITTPFTFIATSNAILFNHAKPVFADIDPRSFNIDAVKIEKKITDKTKAVLIVHLYGNPCEMERIAALCKKYNLLLVEDCAQAAGAEYKGKKVGSFGDVSVFSFYPSKNMTTGEGGMILTNDKEIAAKCRVIRNQGQNEQYLHTEISYNFRMTEMAAAIGLEQLKRLDVWNSERKENAKYLSEQLAKAKNVQLPEVKPGTKHVFHQYTLRVRNGRRQKAFEQLNSKGIDARIYYPNVTYNQPAYLKLGFRPGICPEAEKAAEEVLSIPVHQSLTKEQLEKIAVETKAAVS
jgi:perosamine synthetase